MEGDNYQILKEWHSLLANSAITQQEFNALKSELLAKNKVPKNIKENDITNSPLPANVIVENTEQIIAHPPETKAPFKNIYEQQTPKRNWRGVYIALLILIVAGIAIYFSVLKKESASAPSADTVNKTNNTPSVNTYTPPPPPPSEPSIATAFKGYYRGGLQSGYAGGTDNAECRIMEDGTATFHYALNAGNGNQEATERGHIIKEQGNYYFKTNDGYGKYDVHIEPDIIYIGNGSSWEAKMYLNGKHTSSKETSKQSSKDVQSLSATGDETKFIEDDPEESTNYESKIRGLLAAEDEKDFSKIESFFSENPEQYFDLKYPTRDQLQKRYQHLWSLTSNPKNTITNIEKKENNKYVVTSNYEYFGLKSQTTIIKRDIRTIFILNTEGEIVSVSN